MVMREEPRKRRRAELPCAPVLALKHLSSGKVRDIYEIDSDRLLLVASDRISAYDVIMSQPIPDKGRVLTGLSLHWFDLVKHPNHLLTTDLDGIRGLPAAPQELRGRSMVVRRAEVIPVECVVRGYLYGSAWREYAAGGGPSTGHLPPGLELGSKLGRPVFTPATKATSGHDQNLSELEARAALGDDLYEELQARSLEIYTTAADYAAEREVLLADTKFEFGWIDGQITLIDEVLTPDSSRYWPAAQYAPGRVMPSYDKQYLRDWLDATGWDHSPPPPNLPPEVIAGTRARYVEAFEVMTGTSFATYLGV